MRYIIDGHTPKLLPKFSDDPMSPFIMDDKGEIVMEIRLVPFGHWIGSNQCHKTRFGHQGKKPEYYRRRNTPKEQRT